MNISHPLKKNETLLYNFILPERSEFPIKYFYQDDFSLINESTSKFLKLSIDEILSKTSFEILDSQILSYYSIPKKKNMEEVKKEERDQRIIETIIKIKKYDKSKKEEAKTGFILNLVQMAKEIGRENTFAHLVPVISEQIFTDKANMRELFFNEIINLYQFLSNNQKGYEIIKNILVPFIKKTLEEKENPILFNCALDALVTLIEFLNPEDQMNYILTIVLEGINKNLLIENRIPFIYLLSKLPEKLGRDMTEQIVGNMMLSLMDDNNEDIRKNIIDNLIPLSKVVSSQFLSQKILPIFKRTRKDQSSKVRMAAVNILSELTSLCEKSVKETLLLDTMLSYLNDSDSKIKYYANLNIGYFISLVGIESDQLLNKYCEISDRKSKSSDELIFQLAFTYPGVLKVYGSNLKLITCLKNFLLWDLPRVNLTLISSSFVIAKIIKSEIAIMDPLIKSTFELNNNFSKKILNNLHEYLFFIDINLRSSHLQIIQKIIVTSRLKFKARQIFASKIKEYCQLFTKLEDVTILVSIILNMINDPVNLVSQITCKHIYFIMKTSEIDKELNSLILGNINRFGKSNRYFERIKFIYMCRNIIENDFTLFEKSFEPILEKFIEDKVLNVKYVLAKTFAEILYEDQNKSSYNSYIQKILKILHKDKKLKKLLIDSEILNLSQFLKEEPEDQPLIQIDNKMIEESASEDLKESEMLKASRKSVNLMKVDEIENFAKESKN